jgi:tartrate dehydratase beta subunit/fumarate hydratase class I family protein
VPSFVARHFEAIWRIEVEDFPAFIIIDDKGNDFFKELNLG